jgi:hypothetical protein
VIKRKSDGNESKTVRPGVLLVGNLTKKGNQDTMSKHMSSNV